MREWQVGDPVGDGNDIGVPDIPYMDYLKDDDESSQEDIVDDFKYNINNARDFYNMNNYETAFRFLDSSFRIYGKMNNFEKSQVRIHNTPNIKCHIWPKLCKRTFNRIP